MLSQEQKSKYEQIRLMAAADLELIDRAIESELANVKKRLLELQEDKKAVKQILDGACARLGAAADPASRPVDGAGHAEALDELAAFQR